MQRTRYSIGQPDKARLPGGLLEHAPTSTFRRLPQAHSATHLYQRKLNGRTNLAQFITSTPAATAQRSSQPQMNFPRKMRDSASNMARLNAGNFSAINKLRASRERKFFQEHCKYSQNLADLLILGL